MHKWLVVITENTLLVIDAMVLVIIAIATIQAFVQGLRVMLLPSATGYERRDVWLRFARSLVAALTFQLAADILETSIAPSLEELMRLATVALVRTLLAFFLGKEVSEIRRRQFGPSQSESSSE